MRQRPRIVVMLAATLLLAGCAVGTAAPHGSWTARTTAARAASTSCLIARRQPDPRRPRVRLNFTVARDHRTVAGRERITFVPDIATTKLVFRLTANSGGIVAHGNHVRVARAVASPGGRPARFLRAGASARTQGGLLVIPFVRAIRAGATVTADIAFTVTLGGDHYERLGRSGRFAWFASAQPLLAWEPGYGWHTEDMIGFPAGESATSEAMDTTLVVRAPAADIVIATGDPARPREVGGYRTWVARTSAARDVSVAAGPFHVSDTSVRGIRLRVGSATVTSLRTSVPQFTRAIQQLADRFGRYPFPSLSVARLPGNGGGGIEYPAAIQMQSDARSDIVHETAHQWFYAMVGNSQSLHPWLDEAFAEYAERLVDRNPEPTTYLSAPGTVDRSIESYGTDEHDYFFVTYAKGAAALEAARTAAGAAAWDRAVRCYVNQRAWRIVDPADFARAIRAFPRAVAILKRAGALR